MAEVVLGIVEKSWGFLTIRLKLEYGVKIRDTYRNKVKRQGTSHYTGCEITYQHERAIKMMTEVVLVLNMTWQLNLYFFSFL